jgi:arsenite methyltransferase
MEEEEIKKYVRDRYARAAKQGSSCCQPATSCCGGGKETDVISKSIGYTDQDLKAVPEGANLGLGCGNPLALASLREGETVLDLGSGAGFDCFLAARQVGKTGKVIGVDMTPEMLDKARGNAEKGDFKNVEFRLGEIENLPVADNQVDIVISNCVINLSPTKERVFREAFRGPFDGIGYCSHERHPGENQKFHCRLYRLRGRGCPQRKILGFHPVRRISWGECSGGDELSDRHRHERSYG